MLLLVSIFAVVLLSAVGRSWMKKHHGLLYSFGAILSVLLLIWDLLELKQELPESLLEPALLVDKLLLKGIFGTAVFIVVMWAGVFEGKRPLTRKLLALRGEWSVLGGFLILPHMLTRALQFWPLTGRSPADIFLYADGVLTLLVLLPLWLTSFVTIRRKMRAQSWKKLQRLAYVFYFLVGLHGLVLHLLVTQVVYAWATYAIIFGLYAILRLRLARKLNRRKTLCPEAI